MENEICISKLLNYSKMKTGCFEGETTGFFIFFYLS